MKNGPRFLNLTLLASIVLMASVALMSCTLGQTQAASAKLAEQAATAQQASQSLSGQMQNLQAQLAAAQAAGPKLQAQVDELQAKLKVASTQPDQTDQVKTLADQVAALKAAQLLQPSPAQVLEMQKVLVDLQQKKVQADTILTAIVTAIQQANAGVQNAQTPAQAVGAGIGAVAPALAAIPVWGWAASLAASLVGNLLQNTQKGQLKQAATSIIQSVGVAAAAGQITVQPSAVATMNAIQTPLAKALVDQHQMQTDAKSLGELTTPLARAA